MQILRATDHGRLTALGVLVLILCVSVSGCALFDSRQASQRDNEWLNNGYSILYSSVVGLKYSNDLLKIKFENDRFQAVIEHVSSFADELAADLERVAQDYPAVEIDRTPIPEMETRKRDAVNKDRLKSLAPIVGRTGPAFERTLLLSSSGALNQTRYLCAVMAEREPEPQLKAALLDAEQRFAGLYSEVVVLLNEEYFKHNTYQPPGG